MQQLIVKHLQANTIASTTGFISPSLAGSLLDHYGENSHTWGIIFGIAGVVLITGGIFYSIFASGEVQEWAKTKDQEKAPLKQNS